jgi:hypothetical protein
MARWPPLDREYLSCSNTSLENADFYMAGVDSVCNDDAVLTAIKKFGYASLDSSIPVFVKFYGEGCDNRSFFEQDIIFDEQGEGKTFSGTFLAWQYSLLDAGLVDYNENHTTTINNQTVEVGMPLVPAFSNLQERWKALQPTGIRMSSYTPSLTQPACPTFQDNLLEINGSVWKINGSVPLPTQGQIFDENLRMSWERGMNNTEKKKSSSVRNGAGQYYSVLPIMVLAFSRALL